LLKLNPLNILHPNDSMNSQEILNELFDALIFHACCCHDTISILFLTCSRVPRPLKKGSSRDGRRESSDFFEWDIGQHYSINSFSVVLVSFVFPNNVTTNRWVQLLSRSLRNQTCGWDGFLSLSRVSSINSSLPTNMEMDNGSASPISELTFIYSTESYWNYAIGTCELIHIIYSSCHFHNLIFHIQHLNDPLPTDTHLKCFSGIWNSKRPLPSCSRNPHQKRYNWPLATGEPGKKKQNGGVFVHIFSVHPFSKHYFHLVRMLQSSMNGNSNPLGTS